MNSALPYFFFILLSLSCSFLTSNTFYCVGIMLWVVHLRLLCHIPGAVRLLFRSVTKSFWILQRQIPQRIVTSSGNWFMIIWLVILRRSVWDTNISEEYMILKVGEVYSPKTFLFIHGLFSKLLNIPYCVWWNGRMIRET